MDKNILKSLNNLSESISDLIAYIKEDKNDQSKNSKNKENSKNASEGFFGNKMNKNITYIKNDVSTIKSDIKSISDNQKNILVALKNKKDKNDIFQKLSGDKKSKLNIKSGVGTIVLMAGAILAIGKAFSLVAKVDFATVIALSVSLPLLAMAFEKIAMIKKLNVGTVSATLLVILGISAAIMGSSMILSNVANISMKQMASILVVGTALGIATYLMTPIITNKTFAKLKPAQILTLPLLLMGIASAMVGASFAFQYFQSINPAVLLNIALSGISFGIAFTAMSIPISILALAISKVGIGNFMLGAVGLVITAGAFAAASYLVQFGSYTTEIPLGFGVSFGLTMALLAIPIAILGAIGVPTVAMGSAGLVIMALGFALATQVLSLANFDVMKSMADVVTYAIGSLLKNVVPYLLPIGSALANFITLIQPPITAFVQGVFPLLKEMIVDVIGVMMPAITLVVNMLSNILPILLNVVNNIINAFSSILPNLVMVFDSIGNVIYKIGDAISNVMNSISNGISNILSSVTNSIMTLSSLSLGDMLGVGTGLAAIAIGFTAIAASLAANSLSNLFGGDSVLDKILSVSNNATKIILAGKGIEYLSSSLRSLSTFDTDGVKQVNKAINAVNNSSLSELAKNAGMVVTITPSDLKTLLSDEDSNVELIPNNTSKSESVNTSSINSGGNNTLVMNQMIESQNITNNLLQQIVTNTNSFSKIYKELKNNSKPIKTNNDKR